MIAKAKSISHGINALNYITGVSANKKHPEKIYHIYDNFLPPGIDPLGIWNSVRLDSLSRPRMKNNLIRIEISPASEHTRNYTPDDWKQLWQDFVTEFDRQEMKDKTGRLLSPRTNLAGSKSTVWLHLESDSGTPHLHAVVSRLDENGNINDDRNIHLRAQRAAERIARKRGWQTAANIHDINRQSVSRDCLDVLSQMREWSLEDYFARLESKGYDVKVRTDEKGIIRGYILKKGNARFKASELGKGRNLMASKLEGTWNKLRPNQEWQTKADSRESDIRPDYTSYRPDTRRVEFEHESNSYTRFIPEKVMQVFDDEFDSREMDNWADLINEACYHFAVAMGYMAFLNTPTYVSGGGGASNNDLPKKRDDLRPRPSLCRHSPLQDRNHKKTRIQKITDCIMALKKIDISGIDSTIAETREDELRQKEIEAQSDLALQIRLFMKETPYIINEIREAASPMDAQKFSSAVSENLQKSATEMAATFNAKVKPMADKMETARNCVIVPALAAYIILFSLIWLFVFLALVIFANSQAIHSEEINSLVSLIIFFWVVSVALVTYLTRKFKWQ